MAEIEADGLGGGGTRGVRHDPVGGGGDGQGREGQGGGVDRPPLERNRDVVRLYKQAEEIARELGHELAEGATGGGSDGNFTAALGVPTLDGLGAVGDGAHALHEHVEIEPLVDRAALIAGLIARVQGEPSGVSAGVIR